MKLKRRGFALTTTLMVVFGVLLAGMTMASLASFNYSLAKDAQLSEEAIEGAHTGLAYAMNVFMQNPKWGTNPADKLPENSINAPGQASTKDPVRFYVTFVNDIPGLPPSVNNLDNMSRMAGPPDTANQNQARMVPPHTALLFVRGVAGQGSQTRSRTIEAVVEFPPSTYALTASNAIVSWDDTWGYHATTSFSPVIVDGQTGMASGNNPVPASVYAAGVWQGAAGGTKNNPFSSGLPPFSVYLDPMSVVSGTVVANNKNTNVVAVPSPTQAMVPQALAIKAADTSQQIPDVKIQDFNNKAVASSLSVDPQTGLPTVRGQVYVDYTYGATGQITDAGVTFPVIVLGDGPNPTSVGQNGDKPLALDNGTLYVDGNVVIPGGLVGPPKAGGGYQDATGSIYVNGRAFICCRQYDPMLYSGSGDGVAIFTQMNMSIYPVGWAGTGNNATSGTSAGVPTMCGTLYTHGNIGISEGIHIFGAMVTAREAISPEGGNIFMASGAHVTYISTFAQFGNLSTGTTEPQTQMQVLYCRETQTGT